MLLHTSLRNHKQNPGKMSCYTGLAKLRRVKMGVLSMSELSANERIILAIDTSGIEEAERLMSLAKDIGSKFVKCGLELSSTIGWQGCSELAAEKNLEWVADAKLDDIPNTVAKTVRNIGSLDHAPFGITIHTTSGIEAMRVAQEEADSIKMLGVTVLTSITDEEARRLYRVPVRQKVIELAYDAVDAGIKGIVSSPLEVGLIKNKPKTSNLFAMIPGTRSSSADVQDQARVGTPSAAIRDGADLLVVGRQITQAENPTEAFEELIEEIKSSIHE